MSSGPTGSRSTFSRSQCPPWTILIPPSPHLADVALYPATAHILGAAYNLRHNTHHLWHPRALPFTSQNTTRHARADTRARGILILPTIFIFGISLSQFKTRHRTLPINPPADMPWVRPVDPHILRETSVQLFRSAVPEEAPLEITNPVEIQIFDDDTRTPEINTSEPPNININTNMTQIQI